MQARTGTSTPLMPLEIVVQEGRTPHIVLEVHGLKVGRRHPSGHWPSPTGGRAPSRKLPRPLGPRPASAWQPQRKLRREASMAGTRPTSAGPFFCQSCVSTSRMLQHTSRRHRSQGTSHKAQGTRHKAQGTQ